MGDCISQVLFDVLHRAVDGAPRFAQYFEPSRYLALIANVHRAKFILFQFVSNECLPFDLRAPRASGIKVQLDLVPEATA